MSPTSRHLAPVLAVAALFLAGCGGDVNDAASDPEPEVTEPDDTGNDGAEESADDAGDAGADDAETGDDAEAARDDLADVQVGSTALGDVLVDADGMTLYLFTNDSDGQSACYDDCAVAWPPLTVDAEPVAGEAVDAGLLGTTERDDGSIQVTYDGSPLYTWASDNDPGDVSGQGVNDVWFVLTPDGEAIMNSDDAAADAADY